MKNKSKRDIFNILLLTLLLFVGIIGCKKDTPSHNPIDNEEPIDTNDLTLPDTLKIISFNILEGGKLDRNNNYNNFVAWVDSVAPDVFAIEEANGFRQRDLEKLAARWGHPYVITNVKATDNYPVALTSKYPLVTRRKVTMNVSHGAIFAKLRDADFNIIVTHLWPQSYWHQQGDGLGNAYRLQEVNIILDSTIRKFPNESNWTFMGDFNSVSRKDYYPPDDSQSYLVTDQINSDGFEDVIHYLHGYKSNQSEDEEYRDWVYYPGRRIDFLFATQPLLNNLIRAYPIYDSFTSTFSDHLHAVCAEFLLKK